MDENTDPRFRDYVAAGFVAGVAIFGAYQLGKLGADWIKEGVRVYKDRKNPNKK